MKTAELTGAVLDRLVAELMGHKVAENYGSHIRIHVPDHKQAGYTLAFCPSTDWAIGGPLIERERMTITFIGWDSKNAASPLWLATRIERPAFCEAEGPTPLIAAMRCYVTSQLGDEVEVPKEFL